MDEWVKIEGKSYERLFPGDKVIFLPLNEEMIVEGTETHYEDTELVYIDWQGAGDLAGWYGETEGQHIQVQEEAPENPGPVFQQYIMFEDDWYGVCYVRKDFRKVR